MASVSEAKSLAVKKARYFDHPQRAKLQTFRHSTGIIIPKPLLDYYGIVNTDSVEVEVSIAEQGYYLKIVHKEGAFY
jgi:hypothetical protein